MGTLGSYRDKFQTTEHSVNYDLKFLVVLYSINNSTYIKTRDLHCLNQMFAITQDNKSL